MEWQCYQIILLKLLWTDYLIAMITSFITITNEALFDVCDVMSQSFRLYFQFYVLFGLLYAIIFICGIYLGEYPTGMTGFILVDFIVGFSVEVH